MGPKSFLKKNSKVISIILAVVITILVFLFRDKLGALQGYGLFGLFLVSIIGNATIILPAPVVITAFVGGAVFNPALVAIVVSLGATIGELTGYFAGYGTAGVVEGKQKEKMETIKKYMQKYGALTLFVLAVIPNPLFDLAGIAAGATGVSLRKYFIVVWLGKLVKFAAFAFAGASSIGFIEKFI
ncbi:MAG TPA: VTT domain-containing protein [Patescibacteria group bacterium]|nr:VTT domain-containing protein [Patescibacteria group bacterium]